MRIVLLAVLLALPAFAEPKTFDVPTKAVEGTIAQGQFNVVPPALSLLLTEEKPASVTRETPPNTKWAKFTLGDTEHTVGLAFGGEVCNAFLDGGEPVALKGGPSQGGSLYSGPVEIGGLTLTLLAAVGPNGTGARIGQTQYRRGEAAVEGKTLTLAVVDQDFDGTFGSAGDFWWLGDATEAAQRRPLSEFNMTEAKEPVFAGAVAYRLLSLGADGMAKVEQADPVPSLEEYLHRRSDRVNRKWFERFDKEAAGFRQAQSMTEERPRGATAPAFHHLLDFEAAKKLAAEQKKPIFLDFETDWCVWCKRLDYYTYPDAEVAEWLSKFVLVKWNCELDSTDLFRQMGGRGYPHMVIVDPQGKKIHEIGGWKKPADFVEELKKAHEAWSKSSAE